MWCFLNSVFISIVANRDCQPGFLCVRARFAGDIERVFPRARVKRTPGRDYLFRAFIPRETVAEALYMAARTIDYGNFKDSVDEDFRHEAYLDVWVALERAQRAHTRPKRKPRQGRLLAAEDADDDWLYPTPPKRKLYGQ